MITFDDGYVSNYRLLFPLLQKYQMKAAICLIVSLTDEDPEGHGQLTWDMCREMQASGLVEIGTLEGRYHLPRISVWQETQLGDRSL